MRNGAARLAASLSEVPSSGSGEALSPIQSWFDRYLAACRIHAGGEDEVLWPALAVARPDLGSVFTTMEDEHQALSDALDAVAAALARGSGSEAAVAAKDLAELVDRHLDGEEAVAVPALVESLGPDLGDLMRKVQQSAGPGGAAIAVPFLLEFATDAERATVLAGLPPPVLGGLEDWEREYRELAMALPGGGP